MVSSGKGRGWNFRRGAKDAPSVEELRERASRGGQVRTPKGFSNPELLEKAIKAHQKSKKVK